MLSDVIAFIAHASREEIEAMLAAINERLGMIEHDQGAPPWVPTCGDVVRFCEDAPLYPGRRGVVVSAHEGLLALYCAFLPTPRHPGTMVLTKVPLAWVERDIDVTKLV